MKFIKYLLIILLSCQESKANLYEDRNVIAGTLSITDLYLIYSTWDSYIVVENKSDNQLLYKIKIKDKCYAKPMIKGDNLYFPMSDKQFSSYNLKTKKIDWTCEIGGVCRSFKLFNDIFIMNEKSYGISGVDIFTGKKHLNFNINTMTNAVFQIYLPTILVLMISIFMSVIGYVKQ